VLLVLYQGLSYLDPLADFIEAIAPSQIISQE